MICWGKTEEHFDKTEAMHEYSLKNDAATTAAATTTTTNNNNNNDHFQHLL
jgi:hypothetical protein